MVVSKGDLYYDNDGYETWLKDQLEIVYDELGMDKEYIKKAMRRLSTAVKGRDRNTSPGALRENSDGSRSHVRVLIFPAVPVQRRSVLRKKMGVVRMVAAPAATSRDWMCDECGWTTCVSYELLAGIGAPVCSKCDVEMTLLD